MNKKDIGDKMKIGILGSGIVGQTLGSGFIKYGHQVKIGTSNASKLKDWAKTAGANASVGSFQDAAGFGELIVLAVKGNAAEKMYKSVEHTGIKARESP